MTLKFLVPPAEQHNYGVWTKGGGFRAYRNLGAAKQSLMARSGLFYPSINDKTKYGSAVITQLVEGEWYVLFDVPEGTAYNNLPWVKEEQKYEGYDRETHTSKYRAVYNARPMTREEYAEWRVAVELERRGIAPTWEDAARDLGISEDKIHDARVGKK